MAWLADLHLWLCQFRPDLEERRAQDDDEMTDLSPSLSFGSWISVTDFNSTILSHSLASSFPSEASSGKCWCWALRSTAYRKLWAIYETKYVIYSSTSLTCSEEFLFDLKKKKIPNFYSSQNYYYNYTHAYIIYYSYYFILHFCKCIDLLNTRIWRGLESRRPEAHVPIKSLFPRRGQMKTWPASYVGHISLPLFFFFRC